MKIIGKYIIEIILILFHFTPFSVISTIVGSIYIFYKIAFVKKVDLFSLFLLLIPVIVFKQNDVFFQLGSNDLEESSWVRFFVPTLKSSFIIGPLAISTKFFAALAVPIRIIRQHNFSKTVLLWFISLLISITGLMLSLKHGILSEGGLTVGLRINLTIGVLLFPLSIEKENLERQIILIIKTSIILLLLGLMTNHWIFIAVSFPAVILFSKEKLIWKLIAVFIILIFFITRSTFTIKLTIIFSLLITWYYNRKQYLKIKPIILFFIIIFPILIVFLTISKDLLSIAELIGSDRFIDKLFNDRGTIWLNSIELIAKSNIFVVPAGRNIQVWDYGIKGAAEWGAGAHNIWIEIMRQNGLTVFFILFIIVFIFLNNLKVKLFFDHKKSKNIILSFLAVYMVYGLTGNSLVYDGVGFLYWLIFSQIIQTYKYSSNENITYLSSK